jgi:hypothetical protein
LQALVEHEFDFGQGEAAMGHGGETADRKIVVENREGQAGAGCLDEAADLIDVIVEIDHGAGDVDF